MKLKSKKLNKNVKLIAAIAVVLVMIIVLIVNLMTGEKGTTLDKKYTIEYIETLDPGIKHNIVLNKDGEIEVISYINNTIDEESSPITKKINYSNSNTKDLKKFILSYFDQKIDEVTINASSIHATKEQYLLESIVYECEGCYELETNDYQYRIHYVIDNDRYYIYLLDDNKIKVSYTEYNERYNISKMESYEVDFNKEINDEMVKVFKELFKDKKEKEQYVHSQQITEEQNIIILSVIRLDSNDYNQQYQEQGSNDTIVTE